MKTKNKQIKKIVFSQLMILIISIFATTFLIAQTLPSVNAESGDSPIIRRIPAGPSTSPSEQQTINKLMQMSEEELKDLEGSLQISYEKGKSEFEKKGLGWEKTVGMGAGSILLTFGSRIFASSLFSSTGGYVGVNFLPNGGVNLIFAKSGATFLGAAVVSFAAALAGSQLVMSIFSIAGASTRNLQAGQTGAWIGTGMGALIGVILSYGSAGMALGPVGWIAAGIAAAITGIYMLFSYKNYSQEIFNYQVGLWQPNSVGENCLECNSLPFGCSEYQCRSYGTGCELINPDSKDQRCIWINPTDIRPPIISFDPESLPGSEYSYVENANGVTIYHDNGGLPAFSGISFGIKVNIPAQCAYDTEYEYGEKIEEMAWMTNLGSTSYVENHMVFISNRNFPSQYALESMEAQIDPDKEYIFYFMCKSKNNQSTQMPFVVNFKLEKGPDTSPPRIIQTDPINNSYLKAGFTEQKLNVYTNEPANCSWSFDDKPYELMEYKMSDCSQNIGDAKFGVGYGCTTVLEGLTFGLNKFYMRCIDKPDLDNSNEELVLRTGGNRVNTQSYIYYITRTNELAISKITIAQKEAYNSDKGSTILEFRNSTQPLSLPVLVLTTSGAQDGKSICTYKKSASNQQIQFYNKGSYNFLKENTDNLLFYAGSNEYTINCCDVAGNCDAEKIYLKLDLDRTPPEISRVYSQDNQIKIITNEKSNCVYSKSTCNYAIKDGLKISSFDGIEHSLNWDTESDLHIKCMDDLGNSPAVNQCQIILRASELYSSSK